MTENTPLPNFEATLAELEQIVQQMENGQQSLEEALSTFQRGMELSRLCEAGLKNAEQRVERLVSENGSDRVEPFKAGDQDS
ncbi:MAG: exodeoxyribonuclease VII small subunit [Gammaproteobacteria bacterium]|uniref:exodeoxyribonuclease VII small subunit n=1 Tax=Acidiferrobacter sp. SPIII_3 TaxID=1281578 RepID=UPI000D73FC5C|nr:exodeoxyribonuclease VII small subunit [Acidiferrobacter sp. SPIII_3]AWP22667.1 exodeoxyribonuclease VII small subunit [Acidiferrobacter sp. SPIII_3]MDA8120470.1 exodeoxyribonuclease VII small subunit [Gammaproteobacteria bacterium]